MAVDLESENCYFRKSLFVSRYTPTSHKTLFYLSYSSYLIHEYLKQLWILQQVQYIRLPVSTYIKLLNYVIRVYDRGFRMPIEGSINAFQWPTAIPESLLKYKIHIPQPDPSTVPPVLLLKAFHMARSVFYFEQVSLVRYEYLHGDSISGRNVIVAGKRDKIQLPTIYFMFFYGRIPVLWEDDDIIIIGTSQWMKPWKNIHFHCIWKRTSIYSMLYMNNVIVRGIDPHVLNCITKHYTLNREDTNLLRRYTQTQRSSTCTCL